MTLVKVANPYLGDATYLESLNTPEKNSTASFSDQCILLPLYVYNIHQDTKSARLIAVSRTYLNNSNITHNALFNSCCDHSPPGKSRQRDPAQPGCRELCWLFGPGGQVRGIEILGMRAVWCMPILQASTQGSWSIWRPKLCGRHTRYNIKYMNFCSVSRRILQLACGHLPHKRSTGLVEMMKN